MLDRGSGTGTAPASRRRVALAGHGLLLVGSGLVVHLLYPQIVRVLGQAPQLSRITWWWFPLMLLAETASFAAVWALARISLPRLSWFAAATSQLASNAASRAVPGGAVVGGAAYYRMLQRAGVDPSGATAALTANSLASNLVLFTLPVAAAGFLAIAARVPRSLEVAAAGGAVLFVLLLAAGALAVRFDGPLRWFGRVAGRSVGVLARLLHRQWHIDPGVMLRERDEIVAAVRPHWRRALTLAAANWLFDYAVLVFALAAVGAEPRLSFVLLAYSGAQVLALIPLTPGGLGFVEAGLAGILPLGGVPVADGLVAVLAYRIFSFWLPIPAGGIAYLSARHRYGQKPASATGVGAEPPGPRA
jgi:uncharacterized membrane protein YbhN (UPF0104 family)